MSLPERFQSLPFWISTEGCAIKIPHLGYWYDQQSIPSGLHIHPETQENRSDKLNWWGVRSEN